MMNEQMDVPQKQNSNNSATKETVGQNEEAGQRKTQS